MPSRPRDSESLDVVEIADGVETPVRSGLPRSQAQIELAALRQAADETNALGLPAHGHKGVKRVYDIRTAPPVAAAE